MLKVKNRHFFLREGWKFYWHLKKIFFSYSDQVTGGCLPQPARLKDTMEISLRKNGFKITTEQEILGLLSPHILVSAVGYALPSSTICAIYLSATLWISESVRVPYAGNLSEGGITLVSISYKLGGTLLTGSKHDMQARLESQVAKYGDNLYLEISRSKNMLAKKFPELAKVYQKILDSNNQLLP